MGDNRLKCRKPLDIDQSINCGLAFSVICIYLGYMCMVFVFYEITAILDWSPYWNIRHFGSDVIMNFQ